MTEIPISPLRHSSTIRTSRISSWPFINKACSIYKSKATLRDSVTPCSASNNSLFILSSSLLGPQFFPVLFGTFLVRYVEKTCMNA